MKLAGQQWDGMDEAQRALWDTLWKQKRDKAVAMLAENAAVADARVTEDVTLWKAGDGRTAYAKRKLHDLVLRHTRRDGRILKAASRNNAPKARFKYRRTT